MELSEKLQKLRKEKNWTQEELAQKLFVSRTAISKWESGRGIPNIDSLKSISEVFGISVDELLSGDELLQLAGSSEKEKLEKLRGLAFGLFDLAILLMLILPMFREDTGDFIQAVSLLKLHSAVRFMRAYYWTLFALSILNGAAILVIGALERTEWMRHRVVTSFALSVLFLCGFILNQQPYAALFVLMLLIFKTILLLKTK